MPSGSDPSSVAGRGGRGGARRSPSLERSHRRWAGALLAGALGLAVTGCVAPPEGPGVDTAILDEPRAVDPQIYTVRIRAQTCEGLGVGSGFILDPTTIVTNRHVVEGAAELEVETSEGESLTVSVSSQGQVADLAVVRLSEPVGSTITPEHAVLAEENPEPGTELRVFGYPEGGPLTITEGEVLDYVADPRLGNLSKVMRSEVEIHPGNSGGPVLDEDDQVIGVVYAIEVATEKSLIVPVVTLARLLAAPDSLDPVEPC